MYGRLRVRPRSGRIVGTPARQLFNLGETGNAEDIRVALANPGVVHWKPLNIHAAEYTPEHQSQSGLSLGGD